MPQPSTRWRTNTHDCTRTTRGCTLTGSQHHTRARNNPRCRTRHHHAPSPHHRTPPHKGHTTITQHHHCSTTTIIQTSHLLAVWGSVGPASFAMCLMALCLFTTSRMLGAEVMKVEYSEGAEAREATGSWRCDKSAVERRRMEAASRVKPWLTCEQ